MDMQNLGRLLIIMGIGIALLGGLFLLAGKIPILKQFGNLPGDIRIQAQGFSCFFPLVSMTLLSIILTVVLNLFIRLLDR